MEKNNSIIIGLDENNKSSFYGNYYFTLAMFSNNQIENIEDNGYKICDSKKINYFHSYRLLQYIEHKYKKHFNCTFLTPNDYDYLISKYKINLNDLTMIIHLYNIEYFCKNNINFLNIDYLIIIDDFMNTRSDKMKYLKECINILKIIIQDKYLSFNKLKKVQYIDKPQLIEKINFEKNAEDLYKSVSIASQIGFCNYIDGLSTIENDTTISEDFLRKNKNNYENFLQEMYVKNPNNFYKLINKYVRCRYPKKSLQKLQNSGIFKKLNFEKLDLKFSYWNK